VKWKDDAIASLDPTLPSVAGMPTEDELRIMAEDIITLAVQQVLDEVARRVIAEEPYFFHVCA
jgi:hypothetical protein